MQQPNAIVPETSHPANPQNVGAAPSGGPNIRDRSTKQPWLPVEKTGLSGFPNAILGPFGVFRG